jgi:nucleoside-diphosphate-sugar epimerase
MEAEITGSGLDWTIIRPTMIYGARGDRNMERLVRVLRKFPLHPILGKGESLLQPIHVRDLATAIVDAFASANTIGRAFNVSGKDALTYRQVVDRVAQLLGKKVCKFSLPLWVAIVVVEIFRRIPGLPRIKGEQVRRLNEDKAFGHEDAAAAWGFNPVDFETGMRKELEDLGILVT